MCVFCKIINKEIPSSIVYENDNVIAILDLSQANEGHTLVMPKAHYDNMLETNPKVFSEVMEVTQKLAKAIDKTFKPDGINILNNTKEAAGQSVMHTHVHIIPRFKGDKINITFSDNQGKFDLNKVRDKIISNL